MIKNLRTGNAIRFGGTQYKKLLREQRDGKVKYFNKKDILLHSKRLKRTSGGSPSDNDDEDACPICFEPNPHMIYLALCGHRVCLACIADWCSKTGLPCGCPTCRGPIFGPKALFEVLKSNNWDDLTDEAERAYSISSLQELRRGKTNPPSATEIERTKREMDRNKKSLAHQIDQEQLRLQIRTNRRTQRESRSLRTNKHDENLAEKMRLATVAQNNQIDKKFETLKTQVMQGTRLKTHEKSLFDSIENDTGDTPPYTHYVEFAVDIMIVKRSDMQHPEQIRNTIRNQLRERAPTTGRLESVVNNIHKASQDRDIGVKLGEMVKNNLVDNVYDLGSDETNYSMGTPRGMVIKGVIVKPSDMPPSGSRANVATLAFEVTILVAMKTIKPNEMTLLDQAHKGIFPGLDAEELELELQLHRKLGNVDIIYQTIKDANRSVSPNVLTASVLWNFGTNVFVRLNNDPADLAHKHTEHVEWLKTRYDPESFQELLNTVYQYPIKVSVNNQRFAHRVPLWRYYVANKKHVKTREIFNDKDKSAGSRFKSTITKYIAGTPDSVFVWWNPKMTNT